MSEHFDIIPLVPAFVSEREWLLRLLAPLDVSLHEYDENPKVMPGAIYLYNSPDKIELSDAFLSAVKKAGNCGLIHLGDEYYRATPDDYEAFDYVVRMFPFDAIMGEGVFPLSLGLSEKMGAGALLPASEREHAWMFAGDWKSDRGAMAKQFNKVPNGYLSLPKSFHGERGVSREAFLENMANAVFAPCPAGNVCVETGRPYEALELGAIPILPGRRFSKAFDDVLGSHPLPIFTSWRDAAEYVRLKMQNPNELDALQSLCQEWWQSFQAEASEELVHVLEAGRRGEYRAGLQQHLSTARVSKFQRLIALLLQQNKNQIIQRVKFAGVRVLGVMNGKGVLTGTWSIGPSDPQTPPEKSDSKGPMWRGKRKPRHPSS